jgi:hypothetical protein
MGKIVVWSSAVDFSGKELKSLLVAVPIGTGIGIGIYGAYPCIHTLADHSVIILGE